jgi:adenylate cyclase, class 2
MQNIELKARLDSLAPARKIAKAIATETLGKDRQRDTYFHVPEGLMKLRESRNIPAELIYYRRPEKKRARKCDYQIVPVDNPAKMRKLLSDSLGIVTVVEKTREIYLYKNVRIHLDRVKNLGTFLEFEAVLEKPSQAAEGKRLVAKLTKEFGIAENQLVPVSYGVLLKERRER